jgi:predicted Zn-dependent peptidase
MRQTRLANGVNVLTERIPTVRSVAVGIWVRHGAAHDDPAHGGASHLLEHMLFKGTRNRSSKQIVMEVEGLGGAIDAYTSREHTSYQVRILDEHFDSALDVLADLVRNPLLRHEDLELERQVVLEEIATVDDTPDDLVFELHGARLWRGHPYGDSILGTRETVTALDAETLERIHREGYTGARLVVAAAGNVSHEHVVASAERLLGDLPAGDSDAPLPDVLRGPVAPTHIPHDTAQTHIVFGSVTPGHSDERRYALVLLSAAFGGGMSSRLFQRLREELALGYAVYSYQAFHSLAGVTGMYLGTRPGWHERAVEAIQAEYARLCTSALDTSELEQVKQQVKGSLMLSLESTSSRLYRLAGFALHDEPFRGLDEVLRRIDAVSEEEIAQVSRQFFNPEAQTVLSLGPVA